MNLQETECAFCIRTFKPEHRSQRFCSKQCCSYARTIVPAPKICPQCGKKFTLLLNFKRAVFCSPQCSGLSRRGENHPLWKGGRQRTSGGYVQINVDGKYRMEHHLVMEEHLGRRLLPHEEVHHKHGVRDDNRIEHLELWSVSQPHGQRVEDKTAWAIEWLRQYAPEALASTLGRNTPV